MLLLLLLTAHLMSSALNEHTDAACPRPSLLAV
jgi:hypothetical protein